MDWKKHGVRIVHAGELDINTPQTSGMTRAAAITHARTGAAKLWAGTMVVQPDAKTGPHHHGELETVLYVVGEGPGANAMGRSPGTERTAPLWGKRNLGCGRNDAAINPLKPQQPIP